MQHLIEFLTKLVDDFSWRRLSLLLSFLALVIITIIIYEIYTSSFFLEKAQKTIDLIKELSDLPEEITSDSKYDLADLTKTIVQQLQGVTNTTTFHFDLSPLMRKIVSTSIPWVLAFIISMVVETDDKATLAGGLIFMSVVSASVGIMLPWQNIIWSNYWVYPVIHFSILISILIAYGNRNKVQP